MQEITPQEIKSLVNKENPIIMDVGCYDGKDSAMLASLFEKPQVYCFECDPRSQSLFKKLNDTNERLHLCHFALGNERGIIDFFQSDSETRRHYDFQDNWSASGSIRYPKSHLELFPDVKFEKVIKVYCTTLDTWYERISPHIIDFIHADVNGGEEDFIRGGMETLSSKVRYLYIEFSDVKLYEGQINKQELLCLLPGFEEIGVYNWQGNFGNVLLKNNSL